MPTGKWTRVETAGPVFRYSRYSRRERFRYVIIGEEVMRVRRVISDTAAWVERVTNPFVIAAVVLEPRDTPFLNAVKGGYRANRDVADQEQRPVLNHL